jgi:hypothetical protein
VSEPLAGFSLQYASATGNFGSTTAQLTELSGSLAPGQYVLVQEAQGAGGTTPLPAPFLTDPNPIAMSATAGKIALVNTTAPLNCGAAATPCSPASLAQIVDLAGYGTTANLFEGSADARLVEHDRGGQVGSAARTQTTTPRTSRSLPRIAFRHRYIDAVYAAF